MELYYFTAAMFSFVLPVSYFVQFLRYYYRYGGGASSRPVAPTSAMTEYKLLNEEVKRQENSLLITGSILITASLILIGQSQALSLTAGENTQAEFGLILASWGIYSIWLFFFKLPALKLQEGWVYVRLNEIEKQLGFDVHSFQKQGQTWYRRWVWLVLLLGLLAAGNWLMGFLIPTIMVLILAVCLLLGGRMLYQFKETDTNWRVGALNRKALKRFLQVLLLIFAGWFGEWPYLVSFSRSVLDWVAGGSAFPRPTLSEFYGYSWRVAFYRGGIDDVLNGFGLLLIPATFWIFYEFLKGKT